MRPNGIAVDGLCKVCVMSTDDLSLHELEEGPAHAFREWPATHFEVWPSGVYTVWNENLFLYVGMAWAHRGDANPKALGVFGRLTRRFIHDHLTYRVVVTSDGPMARALEMRIRRHGLPRSGRPEINP